MAPKKYVFIYFWPLNNALYPVLDSLYILIGIESLTKHQKLFTKDKRHDVDVNFLSYKWIEDILFIQVILFFNRSSRLKWDFFHYDKLSVIWF